MKGELSFICGIFSLLLSFLLSLLLSFNFFLFAVYSFESSTTKYHILLIFSVEFALYHIAHSVEAGEKRQVAKGMMFFSMSQSVQFNVNVCWF